MIWYKRMVWFRPDQKEKIKRRALEMTVTENEYLRRLVDKDKK